jgi:hypothetical protein
VFRYFLFALAGLLVITSLAPAGEKYVKLVNAASGKMLTVEDKSTEAEAKVVVDKDDPDGPSRHWQIEPTGPHLKLTNRNSGKVLDVYGGSKDEYGQIIQWDAKDNAEADNQLWSWDGTGKARRLKSKNSDLVLDVTPDGQVVQMKADPDRKTQLWEVVEVKSAK